jgi:hypothetical protein
VAVVIGLTLSTVVEVQTGGIQLGEPLIFKALASLVLGTPPPDHDLLLHPISFAGRQVS